MLDRKLLESNFDFVVERLLKRKVEVSILEKLREYILEFKNLQKDIENLRANQNSLSKQFGQYKSQNKPIDELQKELSVNKENISIKQDKLNDIEDKLNDILKSLPNIPQDDTPDGIDENDNVEIKKVLTPNEFDFDVKEHFQLAEDNGWIDFTRGVKIAKSRFSALRGDGAKLNRALINYMLDFNANRGFDEVRLPFMANSTALYSTGQLPKFENDLYKIENEDLYLIPTSEVTSINLYQDEILKQEQLPIRSSSYSPCFRKEAGSAGKDTRGIIRQHQFEKVELVSICTPKDSENELQRMIDCVSDLLTSLQLPHRIVQLCIGDMGFSAQSTFDIEVWLPGQNTYREISSISNTGDFQARRSKIRYKNENNKNTLVHTLNGSSLAVGRTIVAIMENLQNQDGSINIPEVLNPYIIN
jgi:seryl-tRNA synthetase